MREFKAAAAANRERLAVWRSAFTGGMGAEMNAVGNNRNFPFTCAAILASCELSPARCRITSIGPRAPSNPSVLKSRS